MEHRIEVLSDRTVLSALMIFGPNGSGHELFAKALQDVIGNQRANIVELKLESDNQRNWREETRLRMRQIVNDGRRTLFVCHSLTAVLLRDLWQQTVTAIHVTRSSHERERLLKKAYPEHCHALALDADNITNIQARVHLDGTDERILPVAVDLVQKLGL